MATESLFATPVIDTEWGVAAFIDAYEEFQAQEEARRAEHEAYLRERSPADSSMQRDPVIAKALERVRAQRS